jgi:CarD family transcriptional regulator
MSDDAAGPNVDGFEVGDKIVHPSHGAGIIAAIEQKEVLDEFSRYYIIELAAQDMRLMVPVRMADEIGLRSVAGDKRSKELLKILQGDPDDLPDDFKKRQSHLSDRLREGDAVSLAEVVRDMAHRSIEKTYSPTEARLYDQARNMLGGELALAQGIEVAAALEQIEGLTVGAAKKRQAAEQAAAEKAEAEQAVADKAEKAKAEKENAKAEQDKVKAEKAKEKAEQEQLKAEKAKAETAAKAKAAKAKAAKAKAAKAKAEKDTAKADEDTAKAAKDAKNKKAPPKAKKSKKAEKATADK